MATPHCVVLGGGFGGVAASHRLCERLGEKVKISLVDRRSTFMMGLRVLWTVAGQATRAEGTRPLDRLSRKGIKVLRDEAVLIDLDSKAVFTRGGARLRYDALVVALGADVRPDLVPGYDPVASNLYDPDQAEAIAARVASFDRGRLGIGILGVPYKCPPAPYECAFLIDDVLRHRGVRDRVEMEVFTPQPSSLPVAGAAACAQVEGRLAARGIRFLPNRKVTGIGGREVVSEEDRRSYDLLIAVPPHRAPGVVKQAGLATGEWIRPDPRICATAAPGVFAVGDVTEIPLANKMMLPKAGVFAEAQGRVAADQIAKMFGAAGQAVEFDGVGYCFMEAGDGVATAIRGKFYAAPEPVIEVADPSPQTLAEKREFEAERLAAWF